ncbi:phage portal protein family protein, partial [Sphaerotilus montanus]|uniref:phage portal protein family protein n=1 Tax=Sphaerotilus montanus TaxID=522889 RepID=UPI003FA26783
RHDIAKSDARSVSAAITRDLVRTYVDVNFGVQERYPRIVIDVTEPEDTKAIVDGIITAAGGHDLPAAWLDQLARGGRLVAPVHDPALRSQVLMVVDKLGDGSIVQRIHEAVRFVPLESGTSDFGHS